MYELNSREEFERALTGNELVIVEYYYPGSQDSAILSEAVKELEKLIDPNILVCKVNALREDVTGEKLSHTPMVRVYYQGALIFEQKGVFENLEMNIQVLRRGIRSTLASKGVKIRV
ncbi:MAG: hypothetical protein ACPLSM_00475 [Thermosphaera sp.]